MGELCLKGEPDSQSAAWGGNGRYGASADGYGILDDGKAETGAINDAEFTGNVLMLLRGAMNFVKSNTKRGWEKLPDGRKNKPEYVVRAVLKTMVNHFIHRDYSVMGGEVHLDIYDDRLTVTSPGGMYNGMLI